MFLVKYWLVASFHSHETNLMPDAIPLRFRPLMKQAIWGGRRLADALGKSLGPNSDYAESWEIVDHGNDQSVVVDGPLKGKTLGELYRDETAWLMGNHWNDLAKTPATFPLLFKFLDCNRVLSVQVHPNDEQGSLLDPPDLGKTEAWVILHSEPESVIYAGLKPGVDREELARHIKAGTTEQALHSFHPEAGDCVFIPAGTVHALGGGLLVAEIQQSSNTTFRLFDWNRTDASGRSRPLHIKESLEVTDYDRGPVDAVVPSVDGNQQRLVDCDKFQLTRMVGGEVTIGGDDRCHLISIIGGEGKLIYPGGETTVALGDTILLPAALSQTQLVLGEATAMRMSPPA